MAILSGFTTGKARKSAGDITYTRLNGQNIAKAKIMRNPNYKPSRAQLAQRVTMAIFGKTMHVLLPAINLSCNPSTYGSRLNAYGKQYKGAVMADMFGSESPLSIACRADPSTLTVDQILSKLAQESFADLKGSVGGSSFVTLSATGTSAACVFKLEFTDASHLQEGDKMGVYVYSAATNTFTQHAQKQITQVELIQDDIDNGYAVAEATTLAGKYYLAIGYVLRGNQVLTSAAWKTEVLAS